MKLPIDMRLNLLSVFKYIMEADDVGDFWQKEYALKDKEELIERVIDLVIAMVKIHKKFTKARKV